VEEKRTRKNKGTKPKKCNLNPYDMDLTWKNWKLYDLGITELDILGDKKIEKKNKTKKLFVYIFESNSVSSLDASCSNTYEHGPIMFWTRTLYRT
jgi:hypothetical protein